VRGVIDMEYVYYGFGLKFVSNIQMLGLCETVKDNNLNSNVNMMEISLHIDLDPKYRSEGRDQIYCEDNMFILDFKEITFELDTYLKNVLIIACAGNLNESLILF
jgi:hypothetical protein